MKLKLHKNIKLFDFINQIKANGNWGYKDYNCRVDETPYIIDATRDSPNNNDWTELHKHVLDSLKLNEEKHN